MFVLLSKTLDFFLAPLSWVLLLVVLALFWRKHPRRVLGLLLGALFVVFLFGSPSFSTVLMRWVDSGARDTFDRNATYDAVIVLGGSLDSMTSQDTGQLEYNGAVERLLAGYSLLREGKAKHVLLAGGNTFPVYGVPPESTFHAKQLRAWGIPEEQIVLEQKSRNTYENAVEAERLARERGWKKLLLVTSAAHMPRAYGCFNAVGLRVDTLPVDHRATRIADVGQLPRVGSLSASTDALREMAGRWIYRIKGYSKEP